MPGPGQGTACRIRGVGRVTEDLQAGGLVVQQVKGDGGLVMLRPGTGCELGCGDQTGLRLDSDVGFEALLPVGAGLMDVPGLGIHGGDHPVRHRVPGDAPAAVSAVGVLGRLHVLARDQRQQTHRVRRLLAQLLLRQLSQEPHCIGDQGIDQVGPGGLVVPGDPWLAWIGVVVRPADSRCGGRTTGNVADHPPNSGNELGDGVLRGHRVVEHRGIQRPPLPRLEDPGRGHNLPHRLEDPVRAGRAGQPPPEVRQQRGIERGSYKPQPAGGLPPQVTPQFLNRFEIRSA